MRAHDHGERGRLHDALSPSRRPSGCWRSRRSSTAAPSPSTTRCGWLSDPCIQNWAQALAELLSMPGTRARHAQLRLKWNFGKSHGL